MGYTVANYGSMIADRVRMEAWERALKAVISPGCTVLDIGTGTGVMALLAARLGAGQVIAVDTNPAIHVAQALARENGLEGRITFHQENSTSISLPEPADVVMSDLHGVLPFYGANIPTVIDARLRHLAPDGVLLARRDTLVAAPVESARSFGAFSSPWEEKPLGLSMDSARDLTINTYGKQQIETTDLLAVPTEVGQIDYRTVMSPDATMTAVFEAQRAGTLHGWALWFDTELAPGIAVSNAPSAPPMIYGQGFFPLTSAVDVLPGDRLSLDLQAIYNEDYVFSWSSLVEREPDVLFAAKQSTFYSTPVSLGEWKRQASGHRPVLSRSGVAHQTALAAMDGANSVEDIINIVRDRCDWLPPADVGAMVRRLSSTLAE